MEQSNELREFKIIGYPMEKNKPFVVKLQQTQDLVFKYDKWTKGKSVALTLSNGVIEAENIEIYISHKELVGLLQFLLDKQNNITINIGKLIDQINIDPQNMDESKDEVEKKVIEAITKSVKDCKLNL